MKRKLSAAITIFGGIIGLIVGAMTAVDGALKEQHHHGGTLPTWELILYVILMPLATIAAGWIGAVIAMLLTFLLFPQNKSPHEI